MSFEPSHMALEIGETGAVLARQLAANASATAATAALLRRRDPRVAITIARGSSDHAALYLAYLIEISLAFPARRSARRSPRSTARRCGSTGRWR